MIVTSSVRLLEITSNAEKLIAKAYGICTNKGEIPVKNIKKWMGLGHLTPVEHASATFEIAGISRSCSHQLVRHRLASISQQSQRYVEMSDPKWIIPFSILANKEAVSVWIKTIEQLKEAYYKMLQLGIKKEDARFLLPNAAETSMIWTANFRELRHVFQLRISPHAQWEIRDLCVRILALVHPISPNVFGDIWEDLRTKYPSFFSDIQ